MVFFSVLASATLFFTGAALNFFRGPNGRKAQACLMGNVVEIVVGEPIAAIGMFRACQGHEYRFLVFCFDKLQGRSIEGIPKSGIGAVSKQEIDHFHSTFAHDCRVQCATTVLARGIRIDLFQLY